ncbi:MAG: Holliday junction branch migration protein RuvA [Tissierellia bacterium]|nr:Holliday junction branch migration protein RuvA [Tissierellia bacterium]
MFDFFKGIIVNISKTHVVIDVQGVGFKLESTERMMENLHIGEEAILYSEFVVSENRVALYGFLTEEDRDIFNLLKTVSKIGPKSALGILGAISPHDLIYAIQTDNKEVLKSCPGVGDKSASRMIVELKDKVKDFHVPESTVSEISSIKSEVIEALESLGYTRYEIQKKLKGLELDGNDMNEALKQALKYMNK